MKQSNTLSIMVYFLFVANLTTIDMSKASSLNHQLSSDNSQNRANNPFLSSIGFYTVQNKKLGPCPPCANRDWKIPAHFGLGSRNPSSYGATKTYYIYDDTEAKYITPDQKELIGRTVIPRRTGYSVPNNQGNSKAGWAAVKRVKETQGSTAGLTNLGSGTLRDPRTVAVSPAMAAAREICQGDMIYDCQFGWMRVEGGCTNSGLGERIDVWMGNVSTKAVNAAWINKNVPMKVFPAGIIPKTFAEKYLKPAQPKGQEPTSCF